jgi:hypothetical protein
MKKLLLILLACLAPAQLLSQAGESGLSFLKLGVAGRGLAMADALTASAEGAAATYYNPAGLPAGDSTRAGEILFTHREWIQDTRVEYLAASIRLGTRDALGFAVNSTTVADIEIRTVPGEPTGTFSARNFAASLSWGRQVSEDLRLGATARFLYEKILIDQASGIAVDLGAQYRSPVENLTFGALLANLGGMNALRSEKSRLPTLLRIGPAYALPLATGPYRVLIAADFLQIFPEGRSYLNLGGEGSFGEVLTARAGYQFGSEGRGLTAGFEVRYGMVGVQYAYAKLSEDLGDAHSFSLLLEI